MQFNDWCLSASERIGRHFIQVMSGQDASLQAGIQATAAIVPGHYASEEHLARAFSRLGKPEAAALIQGKLPTTRAIRSGDLGEIYATEWIDAHSGGYRALNRPGFAGGSESREDRSHDDEEICKIFS